MKLSYEEKREISQLLTSYHGVFYKFWGLIIPEFSDEISTACVGVNKDGEDISFKINKSFWDKSSDHKKCFIIAHEAYHLINMHSFRINGRCDNCKNICLDIPINEGLVKYFGFSRKDVDPKNQYCWVDTVFKNGEAEYGRSFEYYYELLKEKGRINNLPIHTYVNDHSSLQDSSLKGKFINDLIDSLDQNESESLRSILERQGINENKGEESANRKEAGLGAANFISKMENKIVKKKPKWETIIRKYAKKIVEKEFEVSQWAVKNRRLNLLDQSLLLPSEASIYDRKNDKEKQSIFCFLDASGSCWGYKNRFYYAFKAIPQYIDVRLFSFDTVVNELDIKAINVVGGGGTSFLCIENKIQQIIKKEGIAYPQNIFVLTDGYGNNPNPQYPSRWVFLLTSNFKDFVPPKSRCFDLKEFE